MGFFVLGEFRVVGSTSIPGERQTPAKTMVNRINTWTDDEEVPTSYWIVSSEVGNIAVSTDEAVRVLNTLNPTDEHAWVEFRDLFGAQYRLRTKRIDAVWESTEATRRKERRFTNERRSEAKRDRQWDDE
jgi:hypothetical protein